MLLHGHHAVCSLCTAAAFVPLWRPARAGDTCSIHIAAAASPPTACWRVACLPFAVWMRDHLKGRCGRMGVRAGSHWLEDWRLGWGRVFGEQRWAGGEREQEFSNRGASTNWPRAEGKVAMLVRGPGKKPVGASWLGSTEVCWYAWGELSGYAGEASLGGAKGCTCRVS